MATAEEARPAGRWWKPRPVSRRAFHISLALYLLVRIYLGIQPGYLWDTEGYNKGWALNAALYGISQTYVKTNYQYPPLYLYLVQPVGKLYLALYPELKDAEIARLPWDELVFRMPGGKTYRSMWMLWGNFPGRTFEAEPLPNYPLFSFLIKAPSLLFDLVLAALLYQLVAIRKTWGSARAGPGWGRLAAMAYLWNPVVLWYSAYAGTTDPPHCALMLGSVSLLGAGRLAGSAVFLSAAGMMKPLAAPFVPFLALVAAAQQGVRGLLVSGSAGLMTAALICAPFFLAGNALDTLNSVLRDIDVAPFTSVNAHNLWWFFGSWKDANIAIVAGVTPKILGIALFVIAHAALLLKNWSWLSGKGDDAANYTARLALLGAAITASFFYFSTHMHENHLYMTLPLLLAVAGRSSVLTRVTIALSAVCVIGGVLHDNDAPYFFPILNAVSPVVNPQYPPIPGVPFVPYTWLQLIGSYANAVVVTGTVAVILLLAWRMPRSLPGRSSGE